jgi:hypothetical protein
VLEIEAVDGRSRSHASSRVERVSSQGDVRIPDASRGAPWQTALTRSGAESSGETVCGASSFSTPKKGRVGWRAKARNQSIRWKTFRVEAASSLHWGGERAALAVQVVFGDVVERRRSRSVGRARKGSVDRVGGRKTVGVVGRDRESGACDELSPDGSGRGCLQATGDVRGRRNFVVKALPAATTRGGSAWQTSKGVLPTGARAPKKSAGSVDAGGRKAVRRGSKARVTNRRTEAGEANYLVDPPRSS